MLAQKASIPSANLWEFYFCIPFVLHEHKTPGSSKPALGVVDRSRPQPSVSWDRLAAVEQLWQPVTSQLWGQESKAVNRTVTVYRAVPEPLLGVQNLLPWALPAAPSRVSRACEPPQGSRPWSAPLL